MADGTGRLDSSWNAAPEGTAERALGDMISGNALTGEQLVQVLITEGYGARGPAYYPREEGHGGPFYALGNPHNYASLELEDGVPTWKLIMNSSWSDVPITRPPKDPQPRPVDPPAFPVATQHDLQVMQEAMMIEVRQHFADLTNELLAMENRIATAADAREQRINDQIHAVVKNAEASAAAIGATVLPLLPGLAGLLKIAPPAASSQQ